MKVSKNFSIDAEVLQKLEKVAKERKISLSQKVNEILSEWVEKN